MSWMNEKKITGIYVYGPQKRNCYVHVDGVGWRRLWNAHDCQSEAMTILASHARAEDRLVNLLEEEGEIKSIYVW